MMLFGIDVVIVAPGPVKTPIWSKAGSRISRYPNSPYLSAMQKVGAYVQQLETIGLPAEEVARGIRRADPAESESALPHCAG